MLNHLVKAHNGLKGTVRPTHYWVVYDEIKISADNVQGLTHNLSYLYARATKGVSLVPPAYYADIACERGRQWLAMLMYGADAQTRSQVSGGSDPDALQRARQEVYNKAVQLWGQGAQSDVRNTMFYI